MSGWKVGDPVIVELKQYTNRRDDGPRPTCTGIVTKVARKYFTVALEGTNDPEQFDIATGWERPKNPDFTNYLDQAFTPEGYEAELVRRDVLRRLADEHRFHGQPGSTLNLNFWADVHLVELLALLDRVKAAAENRAVGGVGDE